MAWVGFRERKKPGLTSPGPLAWELRAGLRRLVGCLRGEVLAHHGGCGRGALFVPAEDEAGYDDPKGEKSYEGGSGGDGNHFLSPRWGGRRCPFRWKQYRARLLRGFCASVTTVLPIGAIVGNLRRLGSILGRGYAQPPVLALAAAFALVSARPQLEAELALAVGQVALIQAPAGVRSIQIAGQRHGFFTR